MKKEDENQSQCKLVLNVWLDCLRTKKNATENLSLRMEKHILNALKRALRGWIGRNICLKLSMMKIRRSTKKSTATNGWLRSRRVFATDDPKKWLILILPRKWSRMSNRRSRSTSSQSSSSQASITSLSHVLRVMLPRTWTSLCKQQSCKSVRSQYLLWLKREELK